MALKLQPWFFFSPSNKKTPAFKEFHCVSITNVEWINLDVDVVPCGRMPSRAQFEIFRVFLISWALKEAPYWIGRESRLVRSDEQLEESFDLDTFVLDIINIIEFTLILNYIAVYIVHTTQLCQIIVYQFAEKKVL